MNAASPQSLTIQQQLVAHIDELEEEVRQLRELLVPPVVFPDEWRLTPQEAAVLAAMARHPVCANRQLREAASSRARDKVADAVKQQ